MCSVPFLSSTRAVASVSPSTLFLSAFLPGPAPGKEQIQKINFPGSLAAVSLHQIFPGDIQVGWPHLNPVIMPATSSWMESFLFFLTLFQHREIV